jgi:BirA family biotin operon repressor/biotin-[acetyl-CoA-carboxylase] ligase
MPECHSTNDIAATIGKTKGAFEGTVIVTDHQTKGRGQRGNHWQSTKGENLTFSVILNPTFVKATDHFQLHYVVSMAVYKTLRGLVKDVKIKWPNDILVKRKKICGILIENSISKGHIENSIIGIGLNVNQTSFDYDRATSLMDLTGALHSRESILASLCEHLEAAYLSLRAGNLAALKAQYLKGLFQYKQLAVYEAHGETFSGSIEGVDPHGRLMIERAGDVQYYDFKEVSFHY